MRRHFRVFHVVVLALAVVSLPSAEAATRVSTDKPTTSRRRAKAKSKRERQQKRPGLRARLRSQKKLLGNMRRSKRLDKLVKLVLDGRVKPGVLAGPGIPRAPSRSGRLIVVNKGQRPHPKDPHGSNIMLVDLKTGNVAKTIPTVEGPHEISVSPHFHKAVIPNYGGQPQEAGMKAGGGDSISVLDLKTEKLSNIKFKKFFRPHGVEWLDRDRVAITVDGTKKSIKGGYVLIVNVVSRKIEKAIPTGQRGSHLVRLAPDGRDLYVTNIQGESMTVIRRSSVTNSKNPWASAKAIKSIPTGPGAEGFDIHPTRNEVWVANQDDSTVTVIDRTTLVAKRTFTVAGGPIRLQFTPDKKFAIASLRSGNALAILDATTGKEVKRIKMEVPRISNKGAEKATSTPMMVQFHPRAKNLLYVGNSHSKLVSVVDYKAGTVVGYYKAGEKPDPLAWYPGNSTQKQPKIDGRSYRAIKAKYPRLGGADRGTYRGKKGTKSFVLPRRVDPAKDGIRFASRFRRHFKTAAEFKRTGRRMSEKQFTKMLVASTPKRVLARIDRTIAKAIAEGQAGRARPFPMEDRGSIRMALVYSYLHSRDLTVLHSALGYPQKATGVHDLTETVPAEAVMAVAKKPGASRWLKKYAATLKPGTQVNIGFFNPNIVADIWLWRPGGKNIKQDAMNLHRLSDHHSGYQGNWDPIETAVNNVHHQRESIFGVRKEPSLRWMDLGKKIASAEGAAGMAKSGIGAGVVRDTATLMRQLERAGKITPWYLVDGSSY